MAYFAQPPTYVNLGTGTYFGGGIADRNVNLGTVPAYSQPLPATVPNPEYKTNPYGLEDDQALEKWGKSKKIVAKDAPEGFMRNLAGLADFATLGIADFDKRGNLFGGEHLPGLTGGSGYGGQAVLGNVPETIANPALKMPQTQMPNMTAGSPVPGGLNMGQYYGTNAAIGQVGNLLGRQQLSGWLDDSYSRALRARQDADAQDVLTSIAMQNTPLGQQNIMSKRQAQYTDAATANYLRKLGAKALSEGAAAKQLAYEPRANMAHSSANVGNWPGVRMG